MVTNAELRGQGIVVDEETKGAPVDVPPCKPKCKNLLSWQAVGAIAAVARVIVTIVR